MTRSVRPLHRWRPDAVTSVLAILCAAQLMLIVDVVIVNVALPSIRDSLDVPDARLQLTGIAYTLTFGSLLIVAARAGDRFGRRRLLVGGMALFTVASVLTGAAQSPWQLFAGRALQGLGAALVSPNALALLTAIVPEGARRNRALGAWAAVGSAGAIAGQLAGGLLTDLVGWRWVFLVNVPVGVATVVAAVRRLPESRPEADLAEGDPGAGLDLGGAVTLVGGLGALTLGLSRVAEGTYDGVLVAWAVAAAVLLTAFATVERRHPAPLVRFSLLRRRTVRSGNVALALNAGALGGALYFTSLYLQVVLGYSPLAVGAAFAPVTLVVLVVSPYAGRLVGRTGARPLLMAGLTLLALGMVLLARVSTGGSYVADVLPGLALLALGSGISYAPTFVAGTTGVGERDQGLASGLLGTAQELGAAIGLAILAAVATAATTGGSGDLGGLTGGYRAGYLAGAALTVVAVLVASRLSPAVGRTAPDAHPVLGADPAREPAGAAPRTGGTA
jgi:EmrB/QacA subfamily drug resistance transporter